MESIYEKCSQYEDESYVLRQVRKEDKKDLLKVYSDKKALPFFNSDNCGGDDFYYTTEERMEQSMGHIMSLGTLGLQQNL